MRRSLPMLRPLVLLALVGCGADGSGGPSDSDSSDGSGGEAPAAVRVPLLDPEALAPVSADRDPLAEHRPAEPDCPPGAWGPEGGGFEVQTGACDYGAFDQPLPVAIAAGDVVEVVVWHDRLDAPEPATGHIAVWLGDRVLWSDEVLIPAPSGTLEASIQLEETPAPDARLGVHVRNHGFNSWRFVSIDVLQR